VRPHGIAAGRVAGWAVRRTINRLCGSGLDAVGTAARAIKAGEATLMIAGGVESMSRAPFVIPRPRAPFPHRYRVRHHDRLALRQTN